jgi:hypothetical protein
LGALSGRGGRGPLEASEWGIPVAADPKPWIGDGELGVHTCGLASALSPALRPLGALGSRSRLAITPGREGSQRVPPSPLPGSASPTLKVVAQDSPRASPCRRPFQPLQALNQPKPSLQVNLAPELLTAASSGFGSLGPPKPATCASARRQGDNRCFGSDGSNVSTGSGKVSCSPILLGLEVSSRLHTLRHKRRL